MHEWSYAWRGRCGRARPLGRMVRKSGVLYTGATLSVTAPHGEQDRGRALEFMAPTNETDFAQL